MHLPFRTGSATLKKLSHRSHYDLILVGGGTASSLLAIRLQHRFPNRAILLIDSGGRLGAERTHTLYSSQLSKECWTWLQPYLSSSWSGADLHLSNGPRRLLDGHHAIRPRDFHRAAMRHLHDRVRLKTEVANIFSDGVRLADGERLTSGAVIDARGWAPFQRSRVGFQKYLGLELRLKYPHGLTYPLLMDGRCEPSDGFRFFRVFPWSPMELTVEEVHFSDTPIVDTELYREEIYRYADLQGWSILWESAQECAAFPIPFQSDFWNDTVGYQQMDSTQIPVFGRRSGIFHPTTSQALHEALQAIEWLEKRFVFDSGILTKLLTHFYADRARRESFFFLFNRLLFGMADSTKDYSRVEKVYQLPESVLQRFYGARLNAWDRVRLSSLGRITNGFSEGFSVLTNGKKLPFLQPLR